MELLKRSVSHFRSFGNASRLPQAENVTVDGRPDTPRGTLREREKNPPQKPSGMSHRRISKSHPIQDRNSNVFQLAALWRSTHRHISLGEGVIYPVLHSLERNGSLKSKRKAVAGRTRVYYSLTRKGRERLEKLRHDWSRIQGGVAIALETSAHA